MTIDTLYHTFYSGDVVEHYPRDLFISPVGELASWTTNYSSGSSPGSLCTMYHGKNEEGEWIKWMGTKSEPSVGMSSHFQTGSPIENGPNVLWATWTDAFYRIWQEGLGETHYSFSASFSSGYSESRELEGYIKDGITTGIITPDSILAPNEAIITSVNSIDSTDVEEDGLATFDDITLSPNPAVNDLKFDIKTTAPHKDLEVIIYDITGRLCKRWGFKNITSDIIQVEGLPKGMYLLSFTSEAGRYSKKFIKW